MAAGDPILAADYAGIRRATIDLILCRIRQSATQSIPNNVATAINMDAEDFDPFNIHAAGTPSRITPTQAGYYRFEGGAYMSPISTVWDVGIWKNGSTQIASGQRETAGGAQAGRRAGALVYMNGTTDYVEVQVLQASGAAVNTNASARFASWLECWFTGRTTNP